MIEQRLEYTITCLDCDRTERRDMIATGKVFAPLDMWQWSWPVSWTCPDCEAKKLEEPKHGPTS